MSVSPRYLESYSVSYYPATDRFKFAFQSGIKPLFYQRLLFIATSTKLNLDNSCYVGEDRGDGVVSTTGALLQWDKCLDPTEVSGVSDLQERIRLLYTGPDHGPITSVGTTAPLTNTGTVTAPVIALTYTPENTANKAQASGYASLDGTGKIPVAQVPVLYQIFNTTTTAGGAWSVTHTLGTVPSFVGIDVTSGGTITTQYAATRTAKTTTTASGFITQSQAIALLGALGTAFVGSGIAVTVMVVR